MKKFVFTMQAVLNVKRAQEKQLIGELAECNARIREFERIRQDYFTRQEQQNETYKRELDEGLTPPSLMFWRWAQLTIREKIEYQNKVLEQAEDERSRIEKRLVAAVQERKMLEKLREKQWEEYRAAQQRETAAEMIEFLGHEVFEQGGV